MPLPERGDDAAGDEDEAGVRAAMSGIKSLGIRVVPADAAEASVRRTPSRRGQQLLGVPARRAVATSRRRASAPAPRPRRRRRAPRPWSARCRPRPTSRSGSGCSASAAICGRWVMQSTWRASPSARRRSPTARAVWPPTPASTSSNTSVRDSPAPATVISASITRDSSPPDAVSRIGAAGTPGFGASMSSTRSAPVGPISSRGSSSHLERRRPPSRAPPAPRAPASASFGAALRARRRRARRPARRAPPARAPAPPRARSVATSALLEPLALGAAALGVLEHRRDAAAVLSLEPVVALEPLLDLLQAARAPPRASPRSGAARRRGPRPRCAAPRSRAGQRVELGVGAGAPARPAARPRRAACAAPPSPTSGAIASAPPPAAAQQAVDLRAAARARRAATSCSSSLGLERLDLLDLEARAGRGRGRACRPARAAPSSSAARARARARGRPPSRARSSSCVAPAEAVEQVELGRGERQPAVLVLAEEGDQPPAELAQVGRRGRAALRRTRACGPRR